MEIVTWMATIAIMLLAAGQWAGIAFDARISKRVEDVESYAEALEVRANELEVALARTDAQVEFLSLAAVALLPIQSRGDTAEEGYAALLRRIGRMVEEYGPSAEAWLAEHVGEDGCGCDD